MMKCGFGSNPPPKHLKIIQAWIGTTYSWMPGKLSAAQMSEANTIFTINSIIYTYLLLF